MYPQSRQGGLSDHTQRLNTGLRQATGYNNQNRLFTSANQPFPQLSERPVTQQGMVGAKMTAGGPKRKILSRSYFLVLLKQKISEVTSEIASFRQQKENLQKTQETSKNLENRYETLCGEVRELEGNLADYNLALDKQRTGTRVEDIAAVKDHISLQNQKFRHQVDAIFLERKQTEEKLNAFEERIKELRFGAELKLNELSPIEKDEYKQLEVSVYDAQNILKSKARNLEDISRKILEQENELRMDTNRLKAIQLKENSTRFEEKKREVELKIQENSLSFVDLRGKLMEKVKADKVEIQDLEKRAKELRKLNDNTARKLLKLEEDLKGDGQVDDDQKRKFEVLYEREREIDDFLNNFDILRQKRFTELQKLENGNLVILEKVAKNMGLLKHAPNQQELEEISKELAFKRQQAESSEETLKRLQVENLRRFEELQRVDEIEQTLPARISQMKAIYETMKTDIASFENAEQEAEKFSKKAEFVREKREKILGLKDEIKRLAEIAEKDYNNKLKNLQTHEFYLKFTDMEKQLSQAHQLAFGIHNYIQSKEDELNFNPQVEEILKLTKDINSLLVV